MDRRYWIKDILLIGGGMILIPSCLNNSNLDDLALKNIVIDNREEALVRNIIEIIIPSSQIWGANDLKIHQFVLKMVDDCYSREDQQKYIKALKQFNKYANEKTGKNFIENSPVIKLGLLKEIADVNCTNKQLQYFIVTTKELTVLGYTQSEYVMTKFVPYEMIPGRFHGCVKVKKTV